MTTWYDCKLSYETTGENDKVTKISENYLVDAVNLTDAEAILTEEMSGLIDGEFCIEVVKKEKIYEMFESESESTFFKAKVAFIIIDEKKGKEKRVNGCIYIESENIDKAIPDLHEKMKGSMCDYEILSIAKSKIVDVIKKEK